MPNHYGDPPPIRSLRTQAGLSYARRRAEGLKVVLGDVVAAQLELAVPQLRRSEHDVICIVTDVADPESVNTLASRAIEAYGKVHLVCVIL